MTNKKNILISFIGSNDAGELFGASDGAILTALKNEKYAKVIMLWNKSKSSKIDYSNVSEYLIKEIRYRKLAKEIESNELPITDVTDHNHIYSILKSFTDYLDKSENNVYTAAISSGTPAMQVCWILLAESGDFSDISPLRLIRVRDPKFGESVNIPVKLDTSLPHIIRLKNEVATIKRDLLPKAVLDIQKGQITIGGLVVTLSPIEFCYYRYFAERIISGEGREKFSGIFTTEYFLRKIIEFHKESFPDLENMRLPLTKMLRNNEVLLVSTFRGNISKANKKIGQQVKNRTIATEFEISVEGVRGAKFYGIRASTDKILII